MRKLFVFSLLTLFCISARTQVFRNAPKYAADSLKKDLAFLKDQLFNVHADAFTEVPKDQYEELFARLDRSIKDSMNTVEFFKLVKPAIANLSDEHSEISLPKVFSGFDSLPLFLPLTLQKVNSDYVVDSLLLPITGLKKGAVVTRINNTAIEDLVQLSATYTSGYPDQRQHKALEQFGYLYTLATPFQQNFTITTRDKKSFTTKGVPVQTWQNYLVKLYGTAGNCNQLLSYQKFGETGYINACSFGARGDSGYKAYEKAVDSLFKLAKRDQVRKLLIDVSSNSGGNSALGNLIIRQFYTGDCLTYRMNWRRSDAYLNTLKGWGITNERYEDMKPGEVMHYGPDTSWIAGEKDPYKGKVYIVIGNGTFSSAIMFATIIKDNKIATLIGQEPKDGHPTHFGELYGVKLPVTQLAVRFGVKEWIRPLGKGVGNRLIPDLTVDLNGGIDEVIRKLPD